MGDCCNGTMRLTQKQETFCIKYFELGNATEAALIAGYSPRTVRAIASINLTKANIQARIQELRDKVEDASIATVKERKQILTEITRGDLTDYQEVGADGTWLNVGKESPNTRAISEITSRTDEDKSVVTKVRLHSPTSAIDLLNKMDKIYSDIGGNTIVFNIDQAVIDAGNRLEGALKRLAERVLPEALEENDGQERTD